MSNMKSTIKKISLGIITLLILGFGVQAFAATLDELNSKKDQLTDQLDKAQSASVNKQKEIKSLSEQISNLENEISATEEKISETSGQISQTQASIDSLGTQVKKKTAELNDLKKKINAAIVEIYRFSSRSSWELVFSMDNLSETSNQIKYTEAIQVQVKSMYNKQLTIKEELDKQKADEEAKKEELDNLRARQEEYMKGAQYQASQKDKLKNMTAQQKEEYDALAQKLQSEIANISSEIYAERQRQAGGGWQLGGGGSGYSFGCGRVDPWNFYTCQCTSYAAWYWNAVLGKSWTNTRPGSGSAYNWGNLGADQGYSVSSTPRVGAIISWSQGLYPGDQWGHVAIVEAVNSDGTIDLSEYNYVYREGFSRRNHVDPASEGVAYRYIY